MDAIEKDVYVAYQGNSNAYIAIDECFISRIPTGFLVESNNMVFGANGFCQKAILQTDIHWQMRELQIKVESLDVEVNVSVEDEKLYLQQKQQDANYEKIIDFQNDIFFFLYSGALIIPFIWLRWFDFNNFEKVTYLIYPRDIQRSNNCVILFLVKIYVTFP